MAKELHNRLMKIAGQVNAIDRMVAGGGNPVDILTQIHAAKAALTRVAEILAVEAAAANVPEKDRQMAEDVIKRLSGLS